MKQVTFSVSSSIAIQLELLKPKPIMGWRLAEWLQLLEIEVPDHAYLMRLDETERFLLLGACLLRGLLVAGNIPNFECPETSFTEVPKPSGLKLRVLLKLDVVDLVPVSVYERVIKHAFQYLVLLGQIEPDATSRAQVFAKLLKEVVAPLRRVIPCGQSTMHVLRCAHGCGIPFIYLGLGIFQLGWGSRARLVDRSTTDADSAIGSRLSHDKAATAALLRLAGLPHPEHVVLDAESGLEAVAQHLGFPLVVKPTDRDCGIGVSVDINDLESLKAAFKLAKEKSSSGRIIVERQVAGVCHRLFIAHGKLLYAVKRHPMTIHGDGERSIAQLVADAQIFEEMRPPWCRSVTPKLDEEAIATLSTQGLTLDSVPDAGVAVVLRRIESTAGGGFDEEVTQRIHPDNVSVALRASELFKLSVVGVDIITTDISVPWHQNGAIINELNFAPLLGGAAISRSYIPMFLAGLIDGDAKIPVEVFSDQEACFKRFNALREQGKRCFMVSSDGVLDAAMNPVVMPKASLKQHVRALLLRSDVDAVVIYAERGAS